MVKAHLTCENTKAANHPYTWTYQGGKGIGEWVNCPKCMNKLKIKEEDVEDGAGI